MFLYGSAPAHMAESVLGSDGQHFAGRKFFADRVHQFFLTFHIFPFLCPLSRTSKWWSHGGSCVHAVGSDASFLRFDIHNLRHPKFDRCLILAPAAVTRQLFCSVCYGGLEITKDEGYSLV
jgi:hypothetical protein